MQTAYVAQKRAILRIGGLEKIDRASAHAAITHVFEAPIGPDRLERSLSDEFRRRFHWDNVDEAAALATELYGCFLPSDEITALLGPFQEIHRILKPGGWLVIQTSIEQKRITLESANYAEFQLIGEIAWLSSGGPQPSDLPQQIDRHLGFPRKHDEPIRTASALEWSGRRTRLKKRRQDWIVFRKPPLGSLAQSALKFGTGSVAGEFAEDTVVIRDRNPIDVARRLILTFTRENQIVLDPWMGEGDVGCAAVIEKRRFLGIDSDPECVRLARRRIEHWARQDVEPLKGKK